MPTTASDDGVVLGLKFDISRVKQTLDQVKNMVQGMAEDSAKAVAKTDDALEKARKNAEKWKIEPTTKGIEAAQKFCFKEYAGGRGEDADFILQPVEVDTCLTADGCVDHSQQCSGYIDIRNPPFEGSGGKASQICYHAPTKVDEQ